MRFRFDMILHPHLVPEYRSEFLQQRLVALNLRVVPAALDVPVVQLHGVGLVPVGDAAAGEEGAAALHPLGQPVLVDVPVFSRS